MNKLLCFGLSIFILILVSSGCRKYSLEKELDNLPPITQTGARSFGCLINGKAWVPKGPLFERRPNFYIVLDPSYAEGDLSIRTYRIDNDIREDLTINSDSVRTTGTYLINDTGNTRVIFSKKIYNTDNWLCSIDYDGNYSRKGYLKITRYDLNAGVISGEFEMNMVNKNCGFGDTIKITHGRFDYKF
jgi:hypothetical protein